MAASEKQSEKRKGKVGETIDVPAGTEVTRPDGFRVTAGAGGYVLDVPGTFELGDGSQVEAK